MLIQRHQKVSYITRSIATCPVCLKEILFNDLSPCTCNNCNKALPDFTKLKSSQLTRETYFLYGKDAVSVLGGS